MATELEIYIEKGCFNCDQAVRIAGLVRDELPAVSVRVIDLAEPGVNRPQGVFAVPTYILNGKRLSLGNPDERDLLRSIQAAME
jgi:alkyl hydroperoxide reductase subunit AhpF